MAQAQIATAAENAVKSPRIAICGLRMYSPTEACHGVHGGLFSFATAQSGAHAPGLPGWGDSRSGVLAALPESGQAHTHCHAASAGRVTGAIVSGFLFCASASRSGLELRAGR